MGVLEGIRVVDLGRYIAGPMCSALLGDLGADVIRIERPGGGEDRATLPLGEGVEGGASYLAFNRNKRGMTLDIGSPDGRQILKKLIATADIVVVNLPFPTIQGLGLDYETLVTVKPDIILVHTSAFGTDGPYIDRVGFDGVGQAMSGSVYMAGVPDQPQRAGVAWVDVTTAMFNAYGALAALMHRRATGRGQKVETNLFRSALNQTNATVIEQAVIEKNRVPTGNMAQGSGPGDIHRTKDGWVLIQVVSDALFRRWAKLMGEEERWMSDPRFATDEDRGVNTAILSERTARWAASLTTAEVIESLAKAKIPAGPVYSPQQVLDDAHVAAANLYREIDYPGLPRPAPIVEPGARFSAFELAKERPPTVGEHTDQVLAEIGYSPEQIAALREKRVI
ncbi:MAG TPA: CoA transferase [Caulobacteraceae bacterium]|nr:CoA transferase [Caulobacteraceae bacterium]